MNRKRDENQSDQQSNRQPENQTTRLALAMLT